MADHDITESERQAANSWWSSLSRIQQLDEINKIKIWAKLDNWASKAKDLVGSHALAAAYARTVSEPLRAENEALRECLEKALHGAVSWRARAAALLERK